MSTIPTDAALDRLADMLGIPPDPDPAATERLKQIVADAAASTLRPPHQPGGCRCRLVAL